VLQRLRARNGRGDELAHDTNAIRQLVESTRHQGYATRVADFGGDYERPRTETDDGRNSIALPITVDGRVLGCLNITWRRDVVSVPQMVRLHLHDLRRAVTSVEQAIHRARPELGSGGNAST